MVRVLDRGAVRLAEVTGRGDDEDAGVNECLRGDRQRILKQGPERIEIADLQAGRLHAERHVDDANVLIVRVRQHPFERRNHSVDSSCAVRAEDAERDQRRAGRHAGLCAEGIGTVAENRSRDVRAVAVRIARLGAGRDGREIFERAGFELVVLGDARVEDGHADARTVHARHPPREKRAALDARAEIRRVDRGVMNGVEGVGVLTDCRQLAVGDVEDVAVDEAARARVFLELRRKLSALDAHDHAGCLRRRGGGRAVVQFGIQLGEAFRAARRECT